MTAPYDLAAELAHFNSGVALSRAAYHRELTGRCPRGHRLGSGKGFCLACCNQDRAAEGYWAKKAAEA